MRLPGMLKLRQSFPRPRVTDPPAAISSEFDRIQLSAKVHSGESVAVAVGSRGIANLPTIVRAVIDWIKQQGGLPRIIPAMGSHGGGTAEGQATLLASLGITEQSMGAPILSSMRTEVIGTSQLGIPVHFDHHALEADHVFVIGRVKPHTDFVGEIESGLHKMLLIGLGKHEGAKIYHRAIKSFSFSEIINDVSAAVMANCHLLGGLAIVENAYKETALIEAIPPEHFREREIELLKQSKDLMGRLPFDECDLLIVDEIGKDISGTGMDSNVVGRKFDFHAATKHDSVNCLRIYIRGLTAKTAGNACGIGMAEFTNRRTLAGIDLHSTYMNVLTSGRPALAMQPVALESDRDVLQAALPTIGLVEPRDAKIIHIRNTLQLEEVRVSAAYEREARERTDLEILDTAHEFQFDQQGDFEM